MSCVYKCSALAMYVYTLHICNVGNKYIIIIVVVFREILHEVVPERRLHVRRSLLQKVLVQTEMLHEEVLLL